MTTIKPIETQYKGYRFRSRLEARWAVFFDALGVQWEYEKEGYDLGDFGWYLPDFWLPQVKSFAEVKPGKFSKIEFSKCLALISGGTYSCILLDVPVPENTPYFNVYKDSDDDFSQYFGTKILSCDWCNAWYADYELFKRQSISSTQVVCLTAAKLREGRFYVAPGGESDSRWDDTEKACIAARSARFEHGETPDFKPSNSNDLGIPLFRTKPK